MPRLIPAVPVPFDTDGNLDEKGLEPLYHLLADAGVDGVFISGTTGEFPALDDAERDVVLTEALAVFGAERVYAHVGAASARQAQRLAARAVTLGATQLAAITPYYLPAGPAALRDHYRRIADAAGDARLFVYLYRARTTTTVTPEQLAELAEIPTVTGVKISGEPTDRVAEYLRAVPDGFAVYSGNDVEFGAVVRAGGTGAVSGVSSAFPEPFVALRDALTRGDEPAAAAAQAEVEQAVAAVGGNVALIKAALARRGLPAGPTRMALDPPTPAQLDAISAAVRDLARRVSCGSTPQRSKAEIHR
jgi:4-hydroxy-tetrahydrodipicolinate synthase